jgi:hypothetical protein
MLLTIVSFYVQKIMSNLHGTEDGLKWLTLPRNNLADRFRNTILGQ